MSEPTARLSAALADRYRIERELGQGGMATVYLAEDLKHDRKVALKVLKPELAAVLGAERFVQEIKTTAALQHPHILPLFDSGSADGFLFYVMPYIEGETLRDKLNRETQLSIDEAVRITTEVADALDYAHRHGVIHRDIKPENILLHDGRPMVADFGIALALSAAAGGRMTETGMSLGTPHYMSPEQATADKDITARSDVYSLASVLYEMLTGNPPHVGSSAQQIIMKIIAEPVQLVTTLRKSVPPNVAAALSKALEKLPADRFDSAKAFADALTNPSFHTEVVTTAGSPTAFPPSRLTALLVAALVLALAAAAWGWLRPVAPLPVARYVVPLSQTQTPALGSILAVSPDGSTIAFGGGSADPYVPQIWVKRRDHDALEPLPGTRGVANAIFSPDGQWLALVGNTSSTMARQLRKVQTTGGASILVADSVQPSCVPAWLDDGTIVYGQLGARGLRRVSSAGGGTPSWVWPADSGRVQEVDALPGSKAVLFSRCSATAGCAARSLWVLDLRSGAAHELLAGVNSARYLPNGYLLYVRSDGAGLVVRFNLRTLAIEGSPVAVVDSVALSVNGNARIDVSRTGMLVMLRAGLNQANRVQLWWVDREGRQSALDMGGPVTLSASGNAGWALSPDGRRLAISLGDQGTGPAVWIKHLPLGPLSRVTFDSGPDGFTALRPRWTPDGRSITYVSADGDGVGRLLRTSADGTGRSEVITRSPRSVFEGAMSPDGKWIVVRVSGGVGRSGRDIIGYRVGDTTAVPLMANPLYDESAFAISPDSRWIAYESDETGRREVYVRPFPNTSADKWQASTDGGMAPLWSRNGRELFFVDATRHMVAVTVTEGAELHFGTRRTLFQLTPADYLDENTYYTPFDVAPDGRFIMARAVQTEGQVVPLVVVENWFTELKRKLSEH